MTKVTRKVGYNYYKDLINELRLKVILQKSNVFIN